MYNIDGEKWIDSKEVCEMLGIQHGTLTTFVNRYKEKLQEKKGIMYLSRDMQYELGTKVRYLFNKDGCEMIMKRSRVATKDKVIDFCDTFGLDLREYMDVKTYNIKEVEWRERFLTAIKGLDDPIYQKNILNYRIDVYLPRFNIAIEFDEKFHKHTKERDIKRQSEIEKELGCIFVRVSEEDSFEESLNKIIKTMFYVTSDQDVKTAKTLDL